MAILPALLRRRLQYFYWDLTIVLDILKSNGTEAIVILQP